MNFISLVSIIMQFPANSESRAWHSVLRIRFPTEPGKCEKRENAIFHRYFARKNLGSGAVKMSILDLKVAPD